MEAKWVVNGLTDSVGTWSSDIRGLSNDHDDNDRHKSNKGNRFLHVQHSFCTFLWSRYTTTTWICLNSRFCRTWTQEQRQFSNSFLKLWYSPLELNSRKLTNNQQVKRHGVRTMNFETAWIHVLKDVFGTSSLLRSLWEGLNGVVSFTVIG